MFPLLRAVGALSCENRAGDTAVRKNIELLEFNRAYRRHQAAIFFEAGTSESRFFWAARSQANQLDRSSTYHSRAVTPKEFAPSQPAASTQLR
jgi:hypothetical protein